MSLTDTIAKLEQDWRCLDANTRQFQKLAQRQRRVEDMTRRMIFGPTFQVKKRAQELAERERRIRGLSDPHLDFARGILDERSPALFERARSGAVGPIHVEVVLSPDGEPGGEEPMEPSRRIGFRFPHEDDE